MKANAIWQVPSAGGAEQPMGVNLYGRSYQVVAEGIYLIARKIDADHTAYEIQFFDFTARAARAVQALGEVRMGSAYGLSVSPDRKTFLYSFEEGTGADLMLVEDFR